VVDVELVHKLVAVAVNNLKSFGKSVAGRCLANQDRDAKKTPDAFGGNV
jgi:hypothetical protein